MRVVYIFLFLILSGCASKKKQFKEVRDTIYVLDTVFIQKTDSVVLYREITRDRDEKERNDSIVIVKTRDTVMISKYGNQKELLHKDREIATLERMIKELEKKKVEIITIKDRPPDPKEKPKRNIWKYISIFEAGIIAILILLRVKIS